MTTSVSRVSTRLALTACAVVLSACTVHVLPDRPQRDRAADSSASRAAVSTLSAERPAPRPPEDPLMTEVPMPGTTHIGVHGVVAVNASIERVRSVVFGFERYPEFMPNYKACHVVATTPEGARDVRMDIEVLGGILKLWARMEVSPMVMVDGSETYAGRLVDGNVKGFYSKWELREIDPTTTRLTVESFMELRIPLPDSVVNSGSISGAREAILAIKHRAEGPDAAM